MFQKRRPEFRFAPSKNIEIITYNSVLSSRDLIVKTDFYNAEYGTLNTGLEIIETNSGTAQTITLNPTECRKLYGILTDIYKRQEKIGADANA